MPRVLLIVDDDQDSADLLGMVLSLHFPLATILVAHAGHAALELAAQQRPDVAVLDLEMPKMDGNQLAQALRDLFGEAAPALIALSGNVRRLAELQKETLFDYQMSKPTDIDGLVRLLASTLGFS